MTDSEREEYIETDLALCQESLAHFVKSSWHLIEPGREYITGFHIDAISEHLEAVIAGQIRNLIINIPPRHMKSIESSVMFPAWAWLKKPSLRWLFASYAESLSMRDSVKCRRVILSDWYQQRFGHLYQLTGDQNEKRKYENDKSGHRLATSVGGAGTGEGGDIIVVDDPHKVSEVESETVREGVLDWWDGEMSSRGNDPKTVAKIIVMQRVHEKDLTGHLLAQGGWEHLCLPGRFETSRKCITSIGWEDPRKNDGDLLWPKRFGEAELKALERGMGSQRAAGQIQQRPAPAEGNIFKRAWWKFYTVIPSDLQYFALSADLSFDEGKKNSFVVYQIWGRRGGDRYLLDQYRRQIGFTEQLSSFKSIVGKWDRLSAKWVEKKANGAALIDTLKREIPGIIAVEPKGSKILRAEAVSPQVESGNVYLPDPSIAPWIHDYIEEHATFPNAEHDDQVDATSQALMMLNLTRVYDFAPQSITGESKWVL